MSHDTILHRLVRPAVGRLVGTRVSPDLLTGLRLATGLGAAGCFADPEDRARAIGAGLFLVSMLLDRADGELARQSLRFSRYGGRLDMAADCTATMAAFVGLGLGATPAWIAPRTGLWLGVLAAVSTAALFAQISVQPRETGTVPASMPGWFDPDDLMLLVPVAIWCGGASWVLLASAALTPIAALLLAVRRH